jgi:hypothetical protein
MHFSVAMARAKSIRRESGRFGDGYNESAYDVEDRSTTESLYDELEKAG